MMRHQCNLYGVTGRAGEDKASASFVGFLHLFNHACCPNVVFDSATPSRPATLQAARRPACARLRARPAAGLLLPRPAAPPQPFRGHERAPSPLSREQEAPLFTLVALFDVAEGEELCISCTPPRVVAPAAALRDATSRASRVRRHAHSHAVHVHA